MNVIRLYFRNLVRNRFFSLITIGSFAVSIAIVFVLSSFLISEYSYDSYIKNADRIFRIKASENEASIPEQARTLLLDRVPEIEAVTHFIIQPEPVVYNENNFEVRVVNTDEDLFSILPITFLLGSPDNVFSDKHNVVITEELFNRIFGGENPIGKMLNISHKENVQVVAVVKDLPEKSALTGDMFCSTDLKVRYSMSCYNDHCTYFYNTLVLLKPGISAKRLNDKITSVIPKQNEFDKNVYSLIPFKNVYFDTSLPHDSLYHANIKLLHLLAWLTVVLLLLSVFNYINLSVAYNTNRIKELGVRQILGARDVHIYLQFIGEAFITVLMATLIATLIAWLIHPVFVQLFGKPFPVFNLFVSPGLILTGCILLVSIAMISALYPAHLATKVQAMDLLQKKGITKTSGFDVRRSLNIIQFAATVVILVSLIVITRQIKFARNMDYGFDTEQLIRIPVHWKAAGKVDVLMNTLNAIPGVKNSCYSHGTPGGIWNYSQDDEFGKVSMIASDYRFVETFGLKIIGGRNFFENEKNNVCLINRTAMKQAGWDSYEGKKIFGNNVVGLIDDFHYQDLYNKIGALMITNEKSVSHITVRIFPHNISQTLSEIEKDFKRVLPDYGFSFQFYDGFLDSMYKQEEKRAASIRIIAIVAILVSCIGLIGLVEFSTRRKIKEIGIRKVNGANVLEVMALLNKDFVKWVGIAFVLATPVAWIVMHKWLGNFAYKTGLSWWIFGLSGLLTLAIALLTVSWQSWRAATRNPVEALRYE